MEELFELVLKNPFLLLLILGYLATLFRSKPEKDSQTRQQRPNQSPPSERGPMIDSIETKNHSQVEQVKEHLTLSVEEQREEQLQRLQAQLGGITSHDDDHEVDTHTL